MTNDSAFQKREKTLAERIIIIAGIGLVMAIFIHYFFKNEDSFNKAGLQRMANTFQGKVNVVHSQWLMDNQPNIIRLIVKNADGVKGVELISVNRHGWLDSNTSPLDCEMIWRQAMNTPLTFMNEAIGVVGVNWYEDNVHSCRYSVSSGAYFEYVPKIGKIVVNLG